MLVKPSISRARIVEFTFDTPEDALEAAVLWLQSASGDSFKHKNSHYLLFVNLEYVDELGWVCSLTCGEENAN